MRSNNYKIHVKTDLNRSYARSLEDRAAKGLSVEKLMDIGDVFWDPSPNKLTDNTDGKLTENRLSFLQITGSSK